MMIPDYWNSFINERYAKTLKRLEGYFIKHMEKRLGQKIPENVEIRIKIEIRKNFPLDIKTDK